MFRDGQEAGRARGEGVPGCWHLQQLQLGDTHRQTLLMKGLVALSSLRNRTAFHFIRKATVFSHWKQILGVSAAVL